MKRCKQKASKRLEELRNREAKLERELAHIREEIREWINYTDENKSNPVQLDLPFTF